MVVKNKNGFCVQCVVKKTADNGLGVFAGELIRHGRIVWRHVPGQYIVYDEQTFRAAIAEMAHNEVVYELTHVFGLEELPGCLVRIYDDGVLINHSSNANLTTNNAAALRTALDVRAIDYVQKVSEALLDVRYALVANRDIESGEELTIDYAAEADPPFYDRLCEKYGVREDYLDSP